MLKTCLSIIALSFSVSACQLISPLITNYNGVRMDVAHYINHNRSFSLKERAILVEYAKAQQQITAWQRLSPEQQMTLAEQRWIGRWCSEQKIAAKKLDLVDAQIFADVSAQQKWRLLQAQQADLKLDVKEINCVGKF